MKGISIRKKTVWMLGAALLILVLFSILVSYIFYSDAIMQRVTGYAEVESDRTQFFIIFSCAEILMAIILIVIGTIYVENFIVKPIKSMNDAIRSIHYKDDEYSEEEDENGKYALKDLEISSGDELEELYHTLQQFQMETGDYMSVLRQRNWNAEHDSMTMLDNREKFERRCADVYPYADRIYIACLNIVNLHIVNERLGVEAGDSILSKVARELRRLSGDTIHAYRLEEDHFVLVLTGISEDDAISIVSSWNERVGRLNRGSDNFECRLAWGGAFGEGKFEVKDIFRHADAELYCNKVLLKKELS